ncbi:M1 family aminopeptidase [Mucilaginibacter gynuensis]|uniref:Aminopeptidase N n=1 Tax=Mucilaginibacter gynuensis TaxID=1302236 RepID=A0ABP8GDU5_9SPHI
MKFSATLIYSLLISGIATPCFAQKKEIKVEPGVSYSLAAYRHQVLTNIQYDINFNIPADKDSAIAAEETISFDLSSTAQGLQLDFKQSAGHIKSVTINSTTTTPNWQQEHLVIDAKYLHKGANKLTIQFTAGNESLNRNTGFVYALFVPDRARTVFPCFDQPDLKSKFLLTLQVPVDWNVLANAVKKDSVLNGERCTYHFANSDKLPTYLFSFTAGKYTSLRQMTGKRQSEFLHRETDSTKIRLSVGSLFKAHEDAIAFLEQWTGIPYPFQKVGFAAIPDFQFGGMEHPGEIQYKASALFLDDGATKDQYIARSNVISHEVAHMWFGDMVTMAWFNDVWMKEVFANFMADKVTEKLMGTETFNLKFLQDHYPAAYSIDRTAGANPIRQQLDNLQDAGSLYGNIIYHKAPIMMRQLELLMGKDNFRKGVQEYLRKYAYGNATWNDLIAILSKYTKADLYSWNKVWVNQPGRPIFSYKVSYAGDKISQFTIEQHPENGAMRIWPQQFQVTLVYPEGNRSVSVNMNAQQVVVNGLKGLGKPQYILFNADGMGYGLFPVDKGMEAGLFAIANPLQRASAYINAYENMLAGRSFTPAELLKLFSSGLQTEQNEMNLRLLTGYIGTIFWEFTRPDERTTLSAGLERTLLAAMESQTAANNKKVLFKTVQDIYLSKDVQGKMYQIWQHKQAPAGVKLNEDDYISLALTLALKSDTATSVIKEQQGRVTNIDRKDRLAFLMPALSLDVHERDAFFESLKDTKNRRKEAWVVSALYYLNHPLRQASAVKYLPQSLQLVEEIQRTGDVFFPQSWLGAVFGNYQSKEALKVVDDFLRSHPNYNPKLKAKILQATDNLYRANQLFGGK